MTHNASVTLRSDQNLAGLKRAIAKFMAQEKVSAVTIRIADTNEPVFSITDDTLHTPNHAYPLIGTRITIYPKRGK